MMEQITSRVTLHSGDCLDILPTLAECSIDSCVTDPPYGLSFMGRNWDHGVPGIPFWKEVYRVLKPGGHVAAFGASRGYHRMACAIEDAGFEIRDSLMWIYGTGFPKSHDVSKGIDKAAGAKREVIAIERRKNSPSGVVSAGRESVEIERKITAPATDAAREWQGWGTALKPAFEPIVLARKPLSEKTVAANVLRWRTGALNIDGCRIGTGETRATQTGGMGRKASPVYGAFTQGETESLITTHGRWPANVVHDGSDEVVAMFPNSAGQLAPVSTKPGTKTSNVYGKMNREGEASSDRRYTDHGSTNFAPLPGQRREPVSSAARFFYSAKASKADRAGSKHPTVKPVSLMQWLARLITPPGGTVLDPFAGSGTTGAACRLDGFRAVLIEREAEYQQDIRNRFAGLPEAAE